AVCEKRHEPARTKENLLNKRQHRSEISAKKFHRDITQVAFSKAGDRRVDCDNEGRKTCITRTLNTTQSTVAAAHEIELIPHRSSRSRSDDLQAATRNPRRRTDNARLASGA